MACLEGKLSIWIKGGSFSHASDLYVQVFIDDNDVWRTDDKDGFSPDWDSTCVKHIKGDYEKIVLKLMDEDTYGNEIGILDVNINFEEGDVNFFELLGSKLHKEDDD